MIDSAHASQKDLSSKEIISSEMTTLKQGKEMSVNLKTQTNFRKQQMVLFGSDFNKGQMKENRSYQRNRSIFYQITNSRASKNEQTFSN